MVEIKTTAEMLDLVERMGMCDATGDGVVYLYSSEVAEAILDGDPSVVDLMALSDVLISEIDIRSGGIKGVVMKWEHETLIRMHL